jgi:hypothetical protein
MFKVIGILLAAYTVYAMVRGDVIAKSGVSGRTVERVSSPRYFWVVIAIYLGLALALITIF